MRVIWALEKPAASCPCLIARFVGRTAGGAVAPGSLLSIFGTDLAHSVGIGTFFGLIAGVFYAAYLLATQQGRRTLDALSFFWIAAAAATLLLFVASLTLHRPLTGYSTVTWLNFLALGIITQVCGQFAVTYALGTLPASLVSPTLLAQPLLTMVWAVLLLGQVPSVWHVAGAFMLLGGIFIVHRSRLART